MGRKHIGDDYKNKFWFHKKLQIWFFFYLCASKEWIQLMLSVYSTILWPSFSNWSLEDKPECLHVRESASASRSPAPAATAYSLSLDVPLTLLMLLVMLLLLPLYCFCSLKLLNSPPSPSKGPLQQVLPNAKLDSRKKS